MFDRDLVELLRNFRINLSEAKEIQERRKKRRERYDNQANNEGMSILTWKNDIRNPHHSYRKPPLKIANVLKVREKKEKPQVESRPKLGENVDLDGINFE